MTVTDANLLLGRLDPEYFLAGRMRLDPSSRCTERWRRSASRSGSRRSSSRRRSSRSRTRTWRARSRWSRSSAATIPRRFSLLAFGGAGPLHAAAVARALGIPKVIVPQYPGVFSALGLLLADIRVDKIWTQAFRSNDVDAALVNRQFERITERALAELRQEGFAGEPEIRRAINMRYFGQNYEHEVEIEGGELDEAALERAFRRFDELHAERYGYAIDARGDRARQLQGDRDRQARAARPLARERRDAALRALGAPGLRPRPRLRSTRRSSHRSSLEPGEAIAGPAVIEEEGSTLFVEPGMTRRAHRAGRARDRRPGARR